MKSLSAAANAASGYEDVHRSDQPISDDNQHSTECARSARLRALRLCTTASPCCAETAYHSPVDREPVHELEAVLHELENVLRAVVPDLADTLQPGLTDEQIDALSEPLFPFRLPLDLRAMYRWHDGQVPHAPGPHRPVFHEAGFLPLAAAIESYEGWSRAHPRWNPLWFPAFGWRDGLLVILRRDSRDLAGGLWGFAGEAPDMSTAYDSVLSLTRTAIAAWREADHVEFEFLGPDTTMLHDYNPSSVRPDGRPRLTLSMYDTERWPKEWLEAATHHPPTPGYRTDHPVPER